MLVAALVPFFITTCLSLQLGSPNLYRKGDKVEVLVNKIESDKTQLPYGYYNLPFVCPPAAHNRPVPLSLGEILRGDRIWESNYDLQFGVDMPCMRLCDLITKELGIKKADSLIKDGYVAHWLLDGLPGATTFVSSHGRNKYYAAGFPLGFVKNDISYIYNHVMLVIRYHRDRASGASAIVGFEVYPKSVSNEECPGSSKDYKNFALKFSDQKSSKEPETTLIPYTYSVYWREDNSIDYESRWDLYYENDSNTKNHSIHWFSFVNSLVLVFLLSLIVAAVLVKVLKKDIQTASSSLPTSKDIDGNINEGGISRALLEEVNKAPLLPLPLVVFVACGAQMFLATFGVLVLFVINTRFNFSGAAAKNTFFNNHQGAFYSVSMFSLCLVGSVSAYGGIILHKLLNNHYLNYEYSPKKTLVLSMLFSGFLPSLVLSVMLFLNFFVWAKHSSNALPFGTILVLFTLLFIIELPLGMVGGYFGNKRKFEAKSILNTSSTSNNDHSDSKSSKSVSRNYPRSWLLNPLISTAVFGLIPFGVVYVELVFIFNSVWLEKTTFYYMYGFLLISAIMLIIVIAESTIVAIYTSLVFYKNPNWHWLSFRTGSSIGWFVLAYSTYYFSFHLSVSDFVSVLFYFSYMGLASALVGFSGGAIGVLTGLIFTKKIYGTVKID
ncbi:uncharacterized protein CANTADRAFT_89508 [Suhomyces tanzawaensis NRRL Y-17324]|uniref:Transmembrane 9 superfamily member n=1 Tax=Suhomyces tanzawaensis NRRL Y-17324 TaxID=984487 RepID=A0A1E4SK66_9ASCO|nr:uncharacterized protein CANTADRAFT_89508 [Suhomyces tanzawaensis NRRL Y-17324]ODV79894.1 hypothetical protein CANTADRAFT_89508 [Suhomyces tanzawaensis NRRL Y-17324]